MFMVLNECPKSLKIELQDHQTNSGGPSTLDLDSDHIKCMIKKPFTYKARCGFLRTMNSKVIIYTLRFIF